MLRNRASLSVTPMARALCYLCAFLLLNLQMTVACRAEESPVQLDLSSTERSLLADHTENFAPVEIQLGEGTRTVKHGDSVTAAEHTAVQQILSGSGQTLNLTADGAAYSGTVNIATFSLPIANLVIPGGVTATQDFAITPILNLSGNLVNSGQLFVTSSNSSVSSGSINATNIFNLSGALISTLGSTLNLNLTATESIVNQGTIFASGNLALNAGTSIINGLVPSGSLAVAPLIQSAGDLSLTAPLLQNLGLLSSITGNLNIDAINVQNRAVIESLSGNVSLTNTLAPALGLTILSETDAVISALQGVIETHSPASDVVFNTTISGGKLLANELNFSAAAGHFDLSVQDVRGAISVMACTAGLKVTEGTSGLTVKAMNISGDPDLIYTGSGPFLSGAFFSDGGQVNINTSSDLVNGSITFTGDIDTKTALLGAGGNVTLNAGTFINTAIIDTRGTGGNGGSISLSANQGITTGNLLTGTLVPNFNSGSIVVKASQGTVFVDGGISTASAGSGSTPGTVSIAAQTLVVQGNILASNGANVGNGADVFLTTSGNMTLSDIDASGGTQNGSTGGAIILAAGTSGIGTLTAGALTSGVTGPVGIPGLITVTSNGSTSLGALYSASLNGVGGQAFVAVGSGSPGANLTISSVNVSGGTRAGQVVLVNMSTAGALTTGGLDASSGQIGGDVSVTSHGTINTGTIRTAGPSSAGDVWLSSGATSGTAISASSVLANSGVFGGDLYVLRQPGTSSSFGLVNLSGAIPGITFNGTPSGAQSSLTSPTTLSFGAGAVSGYNPGGFDSINISGTLTLNQTARVPGALVARSGGLKVDNLSVVQPALGTIDIVSTGDINIKTLTTATNPALFRAVSTAGTVTLPAINVSNTSGGAIGVLGATGVVLPNGNSLLARGTTSTGGFVSLTAPGGSINLGSAPNTTNNQISVSGATAGGLIRLIAGNTVNNQGVSYVTTGGVLPGRLVITELNAGIGAARPTSSPSSLSAQTPTFATGQDRSTVSDRFIPVSFPQVASTGTILPTDTLPLSIDFRDVRATDDKVKSRGVPLLILSVLTQSTAAELSSAGVDVTQATPADPITLNQGAVIFAPRSYLQVESHGLKVALKAGSVVLMVASVGGVAVFDLHDSASGDVSLTSGRYRVSLWPGAMLAVAERSDVTFSELAGELGVAFRKQGRLVRVDGNMFAADFSIQSVLSRVADFKQLIVPSSRYEHRVASALMKNAVIQTRVGAARGRFSSTK